MAKFLTLENGKMVLRELQNDSGFPFSLTCIKPLEVYTILACRQLMAFNCFSIEATGDLIIEEDGELVILG